MSRHSDMSEVVTEQEVEKTPIEFSLICGIAPLKTMVSTIRQLSDDCVFTFSEDGVSASVVDSSHACLLFSHLPSSKITDIQVEDEVKIAISLESLEGALKLGSKSDTVKLNLTNGGGALALDISGLKKTIRLLDLSIVTNPPTPKIDLEFSSQVKSADFKKGVDAVKTVSECAKLHYDGSKLLMTADSNMETVEAPLTIEAVHAGSDDATYTMLSTVFLTKMVKVMGENLTVSFGDKKPIKLQINTDSLQFEWFLAPRITES